MAPLINRAALGAALDLIERRVPSLRGGDLLIRELLRSEYDAAHGYADTGVIDAHGRKLYDPGKLNAAYFAAGVMNPESGEPYADRRTDPETGALLIDPRTRLPLVTVDEVLTWPLRPALIDHIADVAQQILDLSEVGSAHLFPVDSRPDAG